MKTKPMNRTEFEDTAHSLLGRDVVVILASELPATLRPVKENRGLAGNAIADVMVPWLAEQGRPTEHPVIVLNDIGIRTEVDTLADDDLVLADTLYRQRLHATFLHELAHVVTMPHREPCEVDEGLRVVRHVLYHKWCEGDQAVAIVPDVPWMWHDSHFIRSLLHLEYRFRIAGGERLPFSLVTVHGLGNSDGGVCFEK